jgi:hypothetical protein
MVFPACSAGSNRSQTLWNVLRPYAEKITLMHPHATRYGFDPYNGRLNQRHSRRMRRQNDEFTLWAGVSKSKKFGWDVFEQEYLVRQATSEALSKMRNYYDSHYYHPACKPETRRVYITFAKNAHIHLYRLSQTNASLENVVVLFFPLEDLIHNPLPEWETYPHSVKCYSELSAKIRAYLDFSQLESSAFESTIYHSAFSN